MLDCEEPPRAFVLDDDGSLMALVRLIRQHQPLLTHRRTDLRVDLVPARVEACRGTDGVLVKCLEKKIVASQNGHLYRHRNIVLFFLLTM